jgi:N6-adenosine-specific RNA methylase IME4
MGRLGQHAGDRTVNTMDPLQPFRYGVILADPPWSFRLYSDKGDAKSPQAHYSCMSIEDMQAMPVNHLAAPDCALLMWATAPMIREALALMQAWGFSYKTMGAWAKQSSTGSRWAFGTGYCFRSAAEFFLLGTRGRPRLQSRSTRNLIVAPVREHSRKPDDLHRMAEAMYPGPYLELFARERRPGWDCWGNEVDKFGAEQAALNSLNDLARLGQGE